MTERATSRIRIAIEAALRGLALIALAGILALLIVRLHQQPDEEIRSTAALDRALPNWSTRESPAHVHVMFDSAPSAAQRDWLAALNAVGTRVSWDARGLAPVGVSVEPVADPRHMVRVWIAGLQNGTATLSDSAGRVGALDATPDGAGVWVVSALSGPAHVAADHVSATAPLRDNLQLHPILLLGTAGWEAKFILAALEERGWTVEARLTVSPKQAILQGSRAPTLDPEHYSAIVVLDASAAAPLSQLADFLRHGGGLIVVGDAGAIQQLEDVLPARSLGESSAPSTFEAVNRDRSANPRHELALRPLHGLRDDATVLERQKEEVALAARRVGGGRVLEVGYLDTWRWRMADRDQSAAEDHAKWWSGLVSLVAHAERSDRPLTAEERSANDPAPLAALYSSLGPPRKRMAGSAWMTGDPRTLPSLFGVVILTLLLEWGSRRLRGAH